MKNLIFLLAILFSSLSLRTQAQVDYNDVAVVINTNSPVSVRVGNYFQQQRDIPEINMIRIAIPTSEEIDTFELNEIVQQIDSYLSSNQIKEQINYLVTTKGVPLKVAADQCLDVNDLPGCSSLDSELTLLRGNLINEIGRLGGSNNPYYDKNTRFSSTLFDMYLVTRLDGYTEQDIMNMIDRSGPNLLTQQSTNTVILDISHLSANISGGIFSLFDNKFMEISDSLTANNWSTVYHPDTSVLMNQQNVLALINLNYDPFDESSNHTWSKGSIASMLFSETATTFDINQNPNNKILLADLIAEGATGGFGSTFYTYASNNPSNKIMLNAYLNVDSSYNLAESHFMALRRISLATIIIGDPKTSLKIDFINNTSNPELNNTITLFPNPNTGQFDIRTGEETVNQVRVFNAMGQLVYSQREGFNKGLISLSIPSISNGIYLVELDTENGKVSKKMIVE